MTGTRDHLQPLLDATGVGDDADPAALKRLWALVGDDDPARLDEFLEAVGPPNAAGDGLALRAGQWKIDLREAAVRSTVLTAVVAGVLIPQGLSEFAVYFVTAIVPAVFEIERIELSAGDRQLLVELRLRRDLGSEDELYAALPEEAEINRYDFADFIERLREAGLAEGREGETIVLKAP